MKEGWTCDGMDILGLEPHEEEALMDALRKAFQSVST